MKLGSLVGSGLAMVALLACVCTDEGTSDDTPTLPSGTLEKSASYTVTSPSSVQICSDDTLSEYRACSGSFLYIQIDTLDRCQSRQFAQRADSLFLALAAPETLFTSKAVVCDYGAYVRKGVGTGMQGVWQCVGVRSVVLSGAPAADEAQFHEEDRASKERKALYHSYELDISATTITTYGQMRWADKFVDTWNGAGSSDASDTDSARYSISVKKVDRLTVTLAGTQSMETVTISFNDKGDQTFASSVAAHPTLVSFAAPTACPNERQPEWWHQFRAENMKVQ